MEIKKAYKITYFQEIDSTNTYALRNISDLSDKQVLSADKQTAGRGRFDRKWVSDREDNVYISLILKPCSSINISKQKGFSDLGKSQTIEGLVTSENRITNSYPTCYNNLPLAGLAQYMSVIICRILETYGVQAEIKWPNDVRVNGAKIAGLLSQASFKGAEFKGLILGVGINLNLAEEDLNKIDIPATSLNLLTGKPVDKEIFIEKLLDEFFENYEFFLIHGFPFIKEEYVCRNCFLGKKISVKNPELLFSGIAKEIKDDGSLIILDEAMQERQVITGDIEF